MEVIHEPVSRRFVISTDGLESVLEYQWNGRDAVNFTHTFVPQELRGRGIAERLVRTGLAWGRAQGLQMQASCWYVRRFLERARPRD
jgi:predicted GNAT family acetyltransferase